MHKHLAALHSRLLDPLANRLQLRLERVDAVIAHALDIEHLDPPLTLLDPERALTARAFSCNEMRVRGRPSHTARQFTTTTNTPTPPTITDTGAVRGTREVRGGYERTFADRNDVRDAQRVEHIRVQSVIPVFGSKRKKKPPVSTHSKMLGRKCKRG